MKRNIIWIMIITLMSCNLSKQETTENTETVSENASGVDIDTSDKTLITNITSGITSENKNTSSFTYGIDISHYQGDEMDFLDKKKGDLTFVICKATQGLTLTDSGFYSNWKQIQSKGFIRGAYHFYVSADDAVKQAAFFLGVVPSRLKTDLSLIVDVEGGGVPAGQSVALVQKGLITFLKEVEKETGRKPIIYTDNSTAREYLNNSVFEAYPLWIADYNKLKNPVLPAVWKSKKWLLWQKSESYQEGSFTNDFDVFNGSPDAFRAFISNN